MIFKRLIISSFKAIWRLMMVALGLSLIVAGIVASLTFIGALIGIPLILLGVLFVGRSVSK